MLTHASWWLVLILMPRWDSSDRFRVMGGLGLRCSEAWYIAFIDPFVKFVLTLSAGSASKAMSFNITRSRRNGSTVRLHRLSRKQERANVQYKSATRFLFTHCATADYAWQEDHDNARSTQKLYYQTGGSINRQAFANLADYRFLSIALHAAALGLWLEDELNARWRGSFSCHPNQFDAWELLGSLSLMPKELYQVISRSDRDLRFARPFPKTLWGMGTFANAARIFRSIYILVWSWYAPSVLLHEEVVWGTISISAGFNGRNTFSTQVLELRFAGKIGRNWTFCRRWRIKHGALHLW